MTSEEIIQRLLDEKKITASEALTILKDLARIGMTVISDELIPDKWKDPSSGTIVTVMYGVVPSKSDTTYTYTTTKNSDKKE